VRLGASRIGPPGGPQFDYPVGERLGMGINGYGSMVCINITSYADHSDKLKYRSLPEDQGWIIGA
jgi:hypothetical protein